MQEFININDKKNNREIFSQESGILYSHEYFDPM